jgi:hypothetical protein
VVKFIIGFHGSLPELLFPVWAVHADGAGVLPWWLGDGGVEVAGSVDTLSSAGSTEVKTGVIVWEELVAGTTGGVG